MDKAKTPVRLLLSYQQDLVQNRDKYKGQACGQVEEEYDSSIMKIQGRYQLNSAYGEVPLYGGQYEDGICKGGYGQEQPTGYADDEEEIPGYQSEEDRYIRTAESG